MEVGVRADHEGVILAVVAPEVAQGPGHGQEGDLVHRGAPPDGPGVAQLGSVPHHPGHPGLADHLPAGGLYSGQLDLALGLVVPGQHLGVPVLRVVLVLRAEDDGRVPDVTHEDLAAPDEADTGRGAGGARKPRACLGPVLQVSPHVLLGLEEAFPYGFQN